MHAMGIWPNITEAEGHRLKRTDAPVDNGSQVILIDLAALWHHKPVIWRLQHDQPRSASFGCSQALQQVEWVPLLQCQAESYLYPLSSYGVKLVSAAPAQLAR